MPDKKDKKKSSSRRDGKKTTSSEVPRDLEVDRQLLEELSQLVVERDRLQNLFQTRTMELAARRRGIGAAEELYQEMVNMDFQTIKGLSSSANAARNRRRQGRSKENKNEEVDDLTRNYQELNLAHSMQRTVSTIPRSLEDFTEEEQGMVSDIAGLQRQIAELSKRIREIQTWLDYYPGEDLRPSHFGYDWEDDDNEGDGTLATGEVVAWNWD